MLVFWKTSGAINSRWRRCASLIFPWTTVMKTNQKPMVSALTCRKASRAGNVQRQSSSGRGNRSRTGITISSITFGVPSARSPTTLNQQNGSLRRHHRCFDRRPRLCGLISNPTPALPVRGGDEEVFSFSVRPAFAGAQGNAILAR